MAHGRDIPQSRLIGSRAASHAMVRAPGASFGLQQYPSGIQALTALAHTALDNVRGREAKTLAKQLSKTPITRQATVACDLVDWLPPTMYLTLFGDREMTAYSAAGAPPMVAIPDATGRSLTLYPVHTAA
jgi:hypothetical protein